MIRNQRGEIATAVVIALVIGAAVIGFFGHKLNPFDRSADPSNRRTASALSGKDIVKITKQVENSDIHEVTIDRSIESSSEITDPKLTIGQKIGRFFEGLSTWAVIAIIVLLGLGIVTPAGFIAWSRNAWKGAFKHTVQGIKDVKTKDAETYTLVTDAIAKRHDNNDKVMVDKIKMELNK